MEILVFAAGIAAFYLKTLYFAVIPGLFLFFRWRTRFIFCFLLGIGWGYLHQWFILPTGFSKQIVLKNALILGTIASLPTQKDKKIQVEFFIQQLNHQPASGRILLNCYQNCPIFKPGQTWQMVAQLKKTRSYLNPGGYDYQSALAARHIFWDRVHQK